MHFRPLTILILFIVSNTLLMSQADPGLAVSVVICTRNRADLLADVLRTLCEQALDASRYEIIVVDNGSDDATGEQATAAGATVVREERRGYGSA